MKKSRSALALGLGLGMIAIALTQTAQAEMFSVSAVGALNFSKVSVDPAIASVNQEMGTSLGFGVLGSYEFFPTLSLEAGALYIPRKMHQTGTSTLGNAATADATFKSLEVPVLIRFTGLPIVSFGAGAYFARGLGDIDVSTTSGSTTREVSLQYDAYNFNKNDFGLVASVAGNFPILPTLSILVDARYLFGLANLDSTPNGTGSAKFRDMQLLAGVTFSL